MLDTFFRSHRQVVFRDDRREFISRKAIRLAGDLAAMDIPLPDRTLIGDSRSIGNNIGFYGLCMRQHLRGKFSLHRPVDRALLEIVIFHKWLQLLDREEAPELVAARVGLGTAVQKNMVMLMCDIDLRQWHALHNFGRTKGIWVSLWGRNIAGASAAAYTVMVLCRRPNARVFMPTAHEDARDGIDLLWIESGICQAVSVKCVGGQRSPVRTWHVTDRPNRDKTDAVSRDQRRISIGAERFAKSDRRPCEPVLVHVAKPKDGPIRLNPRFWDNPTWPDDILTDIEAHREAINDPFSASA